MTYGLTEDTLTRMAEVFARMPKLEEVILYGSRAMENYRAGSDIDLALKGSPSVNSNPNLSDSCS